MDVFRPGGRKQASHKKRVMEEPEERERLFEVRNEGTTKGKAVEDESRGQSRVHQEQ